MAFPPPPIHDFAAGVRAALSGFFRKAAEKTAELRERILLGADRLLGKLPPEKRRLVLLASMGGVAVLMLILAGVMAAGKKAEGPGPAMPAELVERGLIPPDEIFLPDEPDFVPGVMLEREQRSMWTAADSEPLWQDPLKDGEEPWRNRIEQTIDTLMESVP